MSKDTPKLNISPDFTMDDIRAIRTYNYEMTKNMTDEERDAYYDKKSKEAMRWWNDFLEKKKDAEQMLIVAEPPVEYKTQCK